MRSSPSIRVVRRDNLAGAGFDLERLISAILELDHRVYDSGSHGHIGTIEQWKPVFDANPDTWRACIDADGALIAYWQTASLKRSQFRRAKRALSNPAQFANRHYCNLDRPGVRNLFLVSVCVDPAHRNLQTQWALVESFFSAIEDLAVRKIIFDEFAAIAHSDEGRQICLTFGMESKGLAADRGERFEGRFADAIVRYQSRLQRRFPRLVEIYGERIEKRQLLPAA